MTFKDWKAKYLAGRKKKRKFEKDLFDKEIVLF